MRESARQSQVREEREVENQFRIRALTLRSGKDGIASTASARRSDSASREDESDA